MQIRDDSVLPYCAVRYGLGRHSTIVISLILELTPMLTRLPDNDLAIISEDIKEYLDKCRKDGVWSVDENDWEKFREAVERERKRRIGLHWD